LDNDCVDGVVSQGGEVGIQTPIEIESCKVGCHDVGEAASQNDLAGRLERQGIYIGKGAVNRVARNESIVTRSVGV